MINLLKSHSGKHLVCSLKLHKCFDRPVDPYFWSDDPKSIEVRFFFLNIVKELARSVKVFICEISI